MDGTEQKIVTIPCPVGSINAKRIRIPFLGIGDQRKQDQSHPNELNYCLSNVMVFKEAIKDICITSNLVGLGPDCTNLNYFMVSV